MSNRGGLANLLASSFLWGSVSVVTQLFYFAGATSFSLVFFRSVLSILILLPFVRIRPLIRRNYIILGAIVALFYEVFIYSVKIAGSALSAVMLYTSILWVPFFSRIFIGEKFSLAKGISSVLVLVGLYSIYRGTPSLNQVILGFFAGMFYGLLISYSKLLQNKGGRELELIASQSLWSLPFVTPLLLFSSINLDSLAGGGYLAVFATVLPYFFFYRGLLESDSFYATLVTATEPVFALILAFIVLHIILDYTQLLGALFILGGIAVSGVKTKR